MRKVLLVTNIPNPYRLPLFNELNRQLKEDGMELKVLFGAAGYSRRKFELDWKGAGFAYEILGADSFTMGGKEKTMMTYSGLWSRIKKERADCIIVSGFSLATMKIWLRSFFRRTDYFIWSGSVEAPGWYDSAIRKWMRRRFVKRAVAFIAYGSKAKEYLVKMGAAPEKVFIACNTVDTDFFAVETQRLRTTLQPDAKRHLLYVGYLEPRKNVMNLLLLMEKIAKERQDVVLDIVGGGSEEATLKHYAEEHHLLDVVKFHGFRQKGELPSFFARTSCFMFQTDFDIWGLVLNEAMAAGIPCLASHQAGATADLIRQGVNGYVLDFRQHEEVLKCLNILLDDPEKAATMGRKAAETIQEMATLKTSAAGFMKALRSFEDLRI